MRDRERIRPRTTLRALDTPTKERKQNERTKTSRTKKQIEGKKKGKIEERKNERKSERKKERLVGGGFRRFGHSFRLPKACRRLTGLPSES